jgi:hypothetical protein
MSLMLRFSLSKVQSGSRRCNDSNGDSNPSGHRTTIEDTGVRSDLGHRSMTLSMIELIRMGQSARVAHALAHET